MTNKQSGIARWSKAAFHMKSTSCFWYHSVSSSICVRKNTWNSLQNFTSWKLYNFR